MAVHSNDRITGITKLNRISLRSSQDHDCVFNNLGHLISQDLMHEAYQQLEERKAVGIDKVTKGAYGAKLDKNISDLIHRIRRKQYKPKASRMVKIPKEDGSTRPLAISCFEDKMVQWAVGKILEHIYEPLFLPSSYGFRPNRSCHDALRALNKHTYAFQDGAIVEMDIRKCFDRIPHEPLMAFLRQKISDTRFLDLVETLITAPIIEDGKSGNSTIGCPQGAIVSPILANIFLHYVIDEWFETIKKTHMQGRCEQIRYADDMVFVFENANDAQRFYAVLGKRLNKFGLELHADKSGILPSGNKAAQRAAKAGKKLPTYTFLGFTCYWARNRKGFWSLKYMSRRDRFAAKLKGLRVFLWENRCVEDTDMFLKRVIKGVKGWINYHSISDNNRKVNAYLYYCERHIYRWFNRRGGKRGMNWENLQIRLNRVGFPRTFNVIPMYTLAS